MSKRKPKFEDYTISQLESRKRVRRLNEILAQEENAKMLKYVNDLQDENIKAIIKAVNNE